MEENNLVEWNPLKMLEITLSEPDDFLKVRETLTRIGVASRRDNILYQSCHILHKQGRYFIVHFKELFALDGKRANLFLNDVSIIFVIIGKNLFVFEVSINSKASRKDIFIQYGTDSLNSFNFVMVKIYEIKKTESNNLVLLFVEDEGLEPPRRFLSLTV